MAARSDSRNSQRLLEIVARPTATAAVFVLVALFLTLLLQHFFAYPFLFLFFGAVMGSAWFGDRIAGIISVALSTVAIAYFFVPPRFSWRIDSTAVTYFIAFIVCASAVSWVSSAKKRTETSIREARDRLEERVLQRTAELEESNREIRERERELRVLTEAIPQQIWKASTDGRIEYCNHHLLAYVGRTIEEVREEKFFEVLHPEDGEIFRSAWRLAVAGGDGLEGEYRVRGADNLHRWFLIRSVPQRDADGHILRWYGTHIDIEDRRRAEQSLVETRAKLSQVTRTMSMGELAASIAHEINQPLTAVVTQAYACREWLRSSPARVDKASATSEKIIQEATRASTVVARIKSLFRRETNSQQRLDINRVVQGLLLILREEALRRDVILRTELASELPRVRADQVQIQQVLLNLVLNGMDAMANVEGARELVISTDTENGEQVLVRVEDCGIGVNPEIAAKIFDSFFSTKPDGIGIGLSISRSIIEAHEGRLTMKPRESGCGAVFEFTIPVRS
jgi:PAS domain S-box-containing protein